MKQLALEVVARTLDPEQIRLLAEEFDRADNNNNGEVGTPPPQAHIASSLFPQIQFLFDNRVCATPPYGPVSLGSFPGNT